MEKKSSEQLQQKPTTARITTKRNSNFSLWENAVEN